MESLSNVRFLFKDIRVDDKEKDYILKKIEYLDKIVDKPVFTEVEISMDKIGKFRVEVIVKTPYHLFQAEETTESIQASIDLLMDSLKMQINKEKDRRKTLIKRGAQSIKKKIVLDAGARF